GERIEQRPAPYGAGLGIVWERVEGTVDAYGANRVEAEAIVAATAVHLRDPMRRERSLAICAMSRAQRDLVEHLLRAEVGVRANDVVVSTPDRLQGEEFD